MSDANFASIAFQKETTWGVAPASPALILSRLKSEEMMHDKATVISDEVRSDRQVSDLAQVGSKASGKLAFELSYLEYQPFIEAALFNSIVSINLSESCNLTLSNQRVTAASGAPFGNVVVGGSVRITGAANAANNGIKHVVSKASDDTHIVLAAGSITADETAVTLAIKSKMLKNGTTRTSFLIERAIQNSAGTKFYQSFAGMMIDGMSIDMETQKIITGDFNFMGKLGTAADASLMATTAVAATGTLTSDNTNVSNNDTVTIGAKTYTFKTALTPTEGEVLIGADADASLLNLIRAINHTGTPNTDYKCAAAHPTVSAAAAVTVHAFLLTARTAGTAGNALATTETSAHLSFGAATLTGGTAATAYVAASTNPVMNGTSNVGQLESDGAALEEKFKSIKIDLKNNLRGLDAIGESGNFDVGVGRVEVTGSFNAYFRNNTLYQAFLAHTYKSLRFTVTDGNGDSIVIFLPRMNFMKGNPSIPGVNTDVMIPMDFTAILDPTYLATIFVSFVPVS